MSRNLHTPVFIMAACAIFFALAGRAQATVIHQLDGGQLIGAHDVDIGGTLYNVEFIDATCGAVFSGCNETSDFSFQTRDDALAAGRALLDQVFLDVAAGTFDTQPTLTRGCDLLSACNPIIPYEVLSPNWYRVVNVKNNAVDDHPYPPYPLSIMDWQTSSDLSTIQANTFARFTLASIPEPTTFVLVGVGLMGLLRLHKKTV